MEPAAAPIEPKGAMDRKVRPAAGRLLVVCAIFVAAAILYLALRILLYRQVDDARHLALKQEYLESVSALGKRSVIGPNLVVILFDDLGLGDFDLDRDPSESYDVSASQPEVLSRMQGMLEARQRELDDNRRGWQ